MSTITNQFVRLSTNFTNDSCRLHADRLRRFIAATLCCLLLAPRVAGQTSSAHPEDVGLSSDALARIKPALQDLVDRQQVSGVITLIARKGKVVYADSVGMQDIETNTPMRR